MVASEFGRAGKVAAALRIQAAVARQCACDLADTIGAKIETDAGIVIANGRQRLPVFIGADERDDKLVRHVFVVGIFHPLHGVGILAAFRVSKNHRVVRLGNALPSPIAIHRIVTAVHGRNFAGVVFSHFLLQLFEIAGAVGGERVTAVHECVDENTIYTVLFRHLQQRVEMSLLRMDATVGEQAEKVQSAFAYTCMLHRREQHRMREEFSVLDHLIDAGDVHVNDATGADVEMSDFAVAHLAFGQADKRAAGVNQRVGIFAQQAVINRLARKGDGIGFGFGAVTPAVEDDENEWFRTRHFSRTLLHEA